MGVPVAVVAEEEVVGGAANGDRFGATVVADLRSEMLTRKSVGGVDVLVAEQAELGRVGPAVENRNLVIAVIAGNALSGSRFGANHFSLSLCENPNWELQNPRTTIE